MSMPSVLPLLVPAAEEAANALPMPAWVFGAIALGVVLLLLLLVWMFRHTAQAMLDGDAAAAHGHGDAHHGHADVHGDVGRAGRAGH